MFESKIMTTTSSFEKMREMGAILIDKTDLIHRMVSSENDAFFLSRPRRFGKSLLVSTLQAYFEGRKELFEGLAIADLEKDWVKYPVFKFDMSGTSYDSVDSLERRTNLLLSTYEDIYGRNPDEVTASERLWGLIRRAHRMTNRRVVVLIDEYDTPLLDVVVDKDSLEIMRKKLKGFYGVLKESTDYLRFVFITGITKFSQLSIFSAMSNLVTISMSNEYASICGITKEELFTALADEVRNMAQTLNVSETTVLARL
ncbi:MAG: AAA family ATPase, partial [Proteobacteria bacterium]|nr:AAA family ATPase [Pseudomonadota bacterium]